jgi:hypothetical protein
MSTKQELGKGIAVTVLAIAFIVYQAYVLHKYWGWFLTPATDLVAPSTPILLGLLLFVRVLRINKRNGKLEGDPLDFVLEKNVALAVAHFIGWIVSLFV